MTLRKLWRRHWLRATERERAPDMSTGDDAKKALERARQARAQAEAHLTELRSETSRIRHEITVNHLAQDIYESMRRRP